MKHHTNSILSSTLLAVAQALGRIKSAPADDPLFLPEGFMQSFAELGEGVKNRISHRANALGKLKEWWHP